MLLQLQNISFGFSKEKKIFTDLSLDVDEGKVYALIGTNGSGKSTLFNLISGFHKPDSGRILFHGFDLKRKEPFEINRMGIGRTFQDLRLISNLTVKENVLLAIPNDPTVKWANSLLPSSFFKRA